MSKPKNSSEVKTYLFSKNVFLNRCTLTNPFVGHKKPERELCDCLVNAKDFYIAIQVKEKETSTRDPESWFNKKVKNDAFKQSLNEIAFLKDGSLNLFANGKPILPKRKNIPILAVIVFNHEKVGRYDPFIEVSRSENEEACGINVFSMKDFEIALDAIPLPYDFANYLLFRIGHYKQFGKRYPVLPVYDGMLLEKGPNDEAFASASYIAREMGNGQIDNQSEAKFNDLLKAMESQSGFNDFLQTIYSWQFRDIGIFWSAWSQVKEHALKSPDCWTEPVLLNAGDKIAVGLVKKGELYDQRDFARLIHIWRCLEICKRELSIIYLLIIGQNGISLLISDPNNPIFKKEMEDMMKNYQDFRAQETNENRKK